MVWPITTILRDETLVSDDVKTWYKTHCPSGCPAVGLVEATPLKELFQAMHTVFIRLTALGAY